MTSSFAGRIRGAAFAALAGVSMLLSPPASGASLSDVERALQRAHPSERGTTWNVSTNNALDPSWLIQSPPPGSSFAPGHSDFLHEELYGTITRAKGHLVLSTLAAPDAAYVATINRALRDLNAQPGPLVDVRIHIGVTGAEPSVRAVLQTLLDDFTAGLPADARLRVSVGTYGRPEALQSFNHAKIVSADGCEALVGGHNWWSSDYNIDTNPVHDVSMRVRGGAARHAEDFFDAIWRYTQKAGTIVAREASSHAREAPAPSCETRGTTRIISAGTLGGVSINASGTSDTAIYALIDTAQRSLKFSAQDLVSPRIKSQPRVFGWKVPVEVNVPQHISTELLDRLAAALLRGVRVEMTLNADTKTDYHHGWPLEKTKQAVLEHLRAVAKRTGVSKEKSAEAELRFELRGLYAVDGAPVRNHAKLIIADDELFYIGSQNLYPGGMKDTFYTQLAEHGYIVDDARAADELLRTHWTPIWRQSRAP